MGATPRTSGGGAIFLNQLLTGFVQRVNENTAGAVKRVLAKGDNAGKEVYELEFSKIEGYITDVKWRENRDKPFGPTWTITIEDNGEKFQINYPEDSYVWFSFAEVLPNIDLSKPVQLIAWAKNDHPRLSVKQLNKEAKWDWVPNLYKIYDNDKKEFKYMYNYPAYPRGGDKDDKKMYDIQLRKFINKSMDRWVENKLNPFILEREQKSVEAAARIPEPSTSNPLYGKTEQRQQEPFIDMDDLPF